MSKPLCFSPKNSPPVAQPIFNIVFWGLVFEDSKEMFWCDKHGCGSEQPVQTYCKLNSAIRKYNIFLNEDQERWQVFKEQDRVLNHLARILIN